MKPGRTSMIAWPRLSATNGIPAIERRNATSSAKNIASAPTSIPVRARRSKRPMYGTIPRVVPVACSLDTRRLVRVPLPHGCADLARRRACRLRGKGRERQARRLSRRDLARAVRRLAAGGAAHEWGGTGLVARAANPEEAEDDARVYDRIRYKTDGGGMLDGRRKHVWVVGVDGSPRQLTEGDWDDAQPQFSPDGGEIAFVSNRTDERDLNTVSDIHVAALDGPTRRITDGRGSYGNPAWAPDGATILSYGTDVAIGSSARNIHLWAFPRDGGPGRDLLEGWDRTVGSSVISDMRAQAQTLAPAMHDGRVLFLGSDQGTANAYSCAATGGDVRAVTMGAHQVVSWSLDCGRRRFAAVLATATDPGNVVVGEVGGPLRKLSCLNDDLLDARYIASPERVEFSGADGWKIEGWLLRPRGFDPAKKWPLVLEIHGGLHTTYGHSFFHEFQ